MRLRVVVVVLLVSILLVAFVASRALDDVEPLERIDLPDAPELELSPPAPQSLTVKDQPVVDAGEVAVPGVDGGEAVRRRSLDDPAMVPTANALSSRARRAACEHAVEACAAKFPPWFSADPDVELSLESVANGSRVVDAKRTAASRASGPAKYNDCVAETLKGTTFGDLRVSGEQRFVDCPTHSSLRVEIAFPSGAKFRDALAQCLPTMPDEAGVSFDVVNEHGVLLTKNFEFLELDSMDAHARRCVELALTRRFVLDADEPPFEARRARLGFSNGGSTHAMSYGRAPR